MNSGDRWEMFGKYYGFPKCCREAFIRDFDRDEKFFARRHKAGKLNGEGSGFVPCARHAELVLAGKVRLQHLIKNRICSLPFPEDDVEFRSCEEVDYIIAKYTHKPR